MKLLTQQIVRTSAFRKRILKLLRLRASKWSFKSSNPNSVDREDRVSNVEFLSVPHIDVIGPAGDQQVELEGTIDMELTLETQLHAHEGEKTISESRKVEGSFRFAVIGPPRTRSSLDDAEIDALKLNLRDFKV
jgi:hypothetical protein